MKKHIAFNLLLSLQFGLAWAWNVSAQILISSVNPVPNALNVSKSTNITVTFNFDINLATLTNKTIKVNGSQSGLHPGSITYNNGTKTVTFTPDKDFKPGEVVYVTLTNGIRNPLGSIILNPYNWSFTIQSHVGPSEFIPKSTVNVGNGPNAVIAADFDGDGDLDLTVANDNSDNVSILKNNGGGSFAQTSTAEAGNGPNSFTAGDWDGDGDLDLAVPIRDENFVAILKNDGNGNFLRISKPSVGNTPYQATAGDFDGDGYLDLAVANYNSSTVSILTNDGSGNFAPTSTVDVGINKTAASVVAGDWDRDGDLDLAVVNSVPNTVTILTNDGSGRFTLNLPPKEAGSRPGVATVGDIDGDGNLDLIVTNTRDGTTISILKNNGSGDFLKPYQAVVDSIPSWVTPGDFDGDGDLDLVVANPGFGSGRKVSILKNDGSGGFSKSSTVIAGIGANAITAGDFDGDEDLDLAVVNNNEGSSGTVSILKNGPAEPFIDVPTALPGAGSGRVSWGDYDNDQDLDILLTGSGESKIYRNDNGSFVPVPISLTGVNGSSASANAWGDYDNDGDLDVLLTGSSNSGLISKIYRNDGGNFVEIPTSLTGVWYGAVAWGDYDNDGDLDILLTGQNLIGSSYINISKIYRNDGGGVFTDIPVSLVGVANSSVAWGDYDTDGDLDILLTGSGTSFSTVSKIYRNDGGTFVDILAPLTPVNSGSGAWGDYDNDGDLDVLLTGNAESSRITKVYRNDSGNFVEFPTSLIGIYNSSAAWGDYDNDGDLDILVSGDAGSGYVSKVYRNDGGNFMEISTSLIGVYFSSVAWGDYNKDGKLDILLSGNTDSDRITKLYRNNTGTANTGPTAPTGLTASVTGNSVTLSWNKANDGQTAPNALTYNLRIGTTSKGVQRLSPMSNMTTGYRQIPKLGNTNHRNSWTIKNLPAGTYYWSIQTIDNAFAGSAFATEQSFTIALSEPFTDISVSLDGVQWSSVAWGDYDNDNDLDILLAGLKDINTEERVTKVYRNDNGSFVPIVSSLPNVSNGSVAWGDYDNDGDLDILLTGNDGANYIAKVYRNDNGIFVNINASLAGAFDGSAVWGDYDNDGDLDICLTGRATLGETIAKLYRNDGSGKFTDTQISLTGVYGRSSAAWGDYDTDGDLDILLAGLNASGNDNTKIYRNDNGNFVDIAASLVGIEHGSVEWGDYDNDGDLDILLVGRPGSGFASKVYRNDHGSFVDIGATLTAIAQGAAAWGDYDNDGDLDILLTGNAGGLNGIISKIYRNDNGTFVDISASIQGVMNSAIAWGDYDKDGDLDILLTGWTGTVGEYVAKVYRNNIRTANTAPTSPTNLTSSVTGNSVNLNWNKSTDNQTVQNALTYNLRVGTSRGGIRVVSPMANTTTGYRMIPKLGNTNHKNSWAIKNLPNGKYYWSAQAIDNVFTGSTFAKEDSFMVGNRPPVVANAIPNQTLTVGGASFVRNLNASPVVFSDPDGDALTYLANSNLPSKVTASISGGTLTVTPVAIGNATITVIANDGRDGKDSTKFVLTVVMSNRPPVVANPIPNQTLTLGGASFTRNLNASPAVFNDPDGDVLAYSASSSATNKATTTLSGGTLTVSSVAVGNPTITITATDGRGGKDSTKFTVTIKDLSPPVFGPFTPITMADINTARQISIPATSITDPNGIKTVELHYRMSGQSFTPINMTLISGNYQASIPASAVTEKSVEFYIWAEDNVSNSAQTPTYSIQVNIPNGITRSVSQPSGSTVSAYQLVSFPLRLNDSSAAKFTEVNPTLGVYNKKVWRMYDFNRSTKQFVEFPNFSFSPERGYLLIVNKPNIQLKSSSGKTAKTAEPYKIQLSQGWSIIGNPFNYDIPRDSVVVENVTLEIYTLANGSWSLNTTGMKAWEGYAVWVSDSSTLFIKAGKAGLNQTSHAFDVANSDGKNWLIQIKAKLNNTEDVFNFVGQNDSAVDQYDHMDLHKAPAFGNDIRLEISHPDWHEQSQETFTTDIRQVNSAGQFYDFDILTSTAEGVGTLSFAGLDKLPNEYSVYLLDENDKTSINLRNTPEHHFTPVSSGKKSFRLIVGTREFVTQNSEGVQLFPTQYQLTQNYPNPFNPATTIRYSIAEPGFVKLEIFDLLGQKIRTLVDAKQPADNYSVVWNGENEHGELVPSGVYFYRLQAGRFEQSRKLILLR